MLDSFEREENVKERKLLHCADCKRQTIHNAEARCIGKWQDEECSISGWKSSTIFRCGACDAVCFETASWHTEMYEEEIEETQYPAPVSAHFTFNTESTPRRLNTILDEMLYSLAGSKMILATIGLRLAVDFIVKDQKCKGNNLKQKINDFLLQGHIDQDQAEVFHSIRDKGNDGAHEAKGMNAQQLIAGMSIVAGLLEKLYNGPARHELTMNRAKKLLSTAEPDYDEDF
jgi:ferredoxin